MARCERGVDALRCASVCVSGVCLCACLLSDGGMISDEGREL